MAFGSHILAVVYEERRERKRKKPLISMAFRKIRASISFIFEHPLIPKLGCSNEISAVSMKLMPSLPNAQSAPKKINDSKFDIFMCEQMIVLGFGLYFSYGTLWTPLNTNAAATAK